MGFGLAWLPPLTALTGLVAAFALAAASGPKSRERLLPALGLGGAATLGARLGGFALLAPAVCALALAAFLLAYRRRGPDRAPCVSCPERGAEVCSGFVALVRRERAFQRHAGRLLQLDGRGR